MTPIVFAMTLESFKDTMIEFGTISFYSKKENFTISSWISTLNPAANLVKTLHMQKEQLE